MKPTSEQTRNAVLATVPFLPQDLLAMKILFGYGAAESPETRAAAHQPATVDPSSAYGCVDWYLYPDSKVDDVAA